MGEEALQALRMKNVAAAAYDYEGDPRWAEYWGNILIPPHISSPSDVIDHYKRKFYQRFIDPDLVVEPIALSSSSQTRRQTTSLRTSSSTTQQRRASNSGSGGSSNQSNTNVGPSRWDRQTIQFSVNAWVFIVTLLAVYPLLPRHLTLRSYRLSFLGTACSSLYSLYSLYGKPRAWNMQAIQTWIRSVVTTKDFIHFLYCLTFSTSQMQIKLALLPLLCRSLEYIARFLRHNFTSSSLYTRYFERCCVWVDSNAAILNIMSSHAEIGLGFLLILSLFSSQRNIMQTIMYWQLLKLMYFAPVTATNHQNVWAKISRSVTPLIHRHAPFLNSPLAAIQRWWFR